MVRKFRTMRLDTNKWACSVTSHIWISIERRSRGNRETMARSKKAEINFLGCSAVDSNKILVRSNLTRVLRKVLHIHRSELMSQFQTLWRLSLIENKHLSTCHRELSVYSPPAPYMICHSIAEILAHAAFCFLLDLSLYPRDFSTCCNLFPTLFVTIAQILAHAAICFLLDLSLCPRTLSAQIQSVSCLLCPFHTHRA